MTRALPQPRIHPRLVWRIDFSDLAPAAKSVYAVGVIKVLNIWHKTRRFLASEDGPTAVEYAVMVALVVGVCIASVNALADATGSSFNKSAAAIISP